MLYYNGLGCTCENCRQKKFRVLAFIGIFLLPSLVFPHCPASSRSSIATWLSGQYHPNSYVTSNIPLNCCHVGSENDFRLRCIFQALCAGAWFGGWSTSSRITPVLKLLRSTATRQLLRQACCVHSPRDRGPRVSLHWVGPPGCGV